MMREGEGEEVVPLPAKSKYPAQYCIFHIIMVKWTQETGMRDGRDGRRQ